MTGTSHTTASVAATGIDWIDGILRPVKWADTIVYYSLPATNSEYGGTYGSGEQGGFFQASPRIEAVVDFTLNTLYGNAADDGFSIEGFTDLRIDYTTNPGAHVRVAQTIADPFNLGTAWGYYPNTTKVAGDIWFTNTVSDFSNPVAGNFSHITVMHEIGHAMGLEHSHKNGSFGAVSSQFDSMEYTIMSYRSYTGAATNNGYQNETWGYAQSFMMLDIAALQYLYGADFDTNSGNTTYAWTPGSGVTMVNGEAAITPGANRIFATIWDGGGIDTYDLSAYSDNLQIDLTPGTSSLFSTTQQANLGHGNKASGNIYNALQYQGDKRSLIENAKGGSGDDQIVGNQANNLLVGNSGNDSMWGMDGRDRLKGGTGNDTLVGGNQKDKLFGGAGDDELWGGSHRDKLFGSKGDDDIYGQDGKDVLKGNAGRDILIGGGGKDTLVGGANADNFLFYLASDSKMNAADVIKDFSRGSDKIDLSNISTTLFTFGTSFSGTGPSVITSQNGGNTNVLVDVDGDASADMKIIVEGVTGLSVGDFIL